MSSFAEKENRRKKPSLISKVAGNDNDQNGLLQEQEYEKKKAGRPKIKNRELKKRYSFTIFPSLYEIAQNKAADEGKTLSELITEFLADYIQQ